VFVNEDFDQIQQQGNSEPDVEFHLDEQNAPETDHALISASPIRPKAKQFIDPDPDEDATADANAMSDAATTSAESNDGVAAAPFLDTAIEDEADANVAQEFEAERSTATAESEDALISARNRDGMAKLNESPRHHSSTERMKKVIVAVRVNRAEAAEILANMHPYLIALGIWQYWCEDVVGIPVKTADVWRRAHDARTTLPPQLLAAVSGISVDISKPKVSNLLLRLADEFYDGAVSEPRIAEMMELVKQATKREPSKPAATAPVPSVPLGTAHNSGDGAATGSGVSENPVPDADPVPDPPKPKPQPKQVKFTPDQYAELEAREEKLRSYLGTSDLTASILAAFRRLEQTSLFELAWTAADMRTTEDEVRACA
jgi:hypothetical protein